VPGSNLSLLVITTSNIQSHCHEDKFKHTNKVSNIFTETTAICAAQTRCETELGTSGSGLDLAVGCCEHGIEPSFFIKRGKFLQ
jgi:hypothetical protein